MKDKKLKSKTPKGIVDFFKLNSIFLKIGLLAVPAVVAGLIIFNFFVDNEKYNITFNTNGGSKVNSIVIDEKGLIEKPNDPTKEGSIFAGWYYKDKLYDFSIPVTKDMTLEAKWESNIEVTGIAINKTRLNLYPNDILKLTAKITPSDATNKNVSWKSSNSDVVEVDSDGNIKALKKGKATITVTTEDGEYTSSVTFTVENKIVKYSVTFRDSGKIIKTDYVNPGQKVTKIQNLIKEGHKFLGWYVDGKEYNFSSTVNKNIILDAKWEKNTYDITFKNYDGSILEVVPFKYGDMPSYDATPIIPGDEKYSYEFAGWNPSIEKVTENATYEATYKKVLNKYKVTFTDENNTLDEQKVEYGNSAIKPENPTKEGYKFVGWYLNNEEYKFTEEVTGNVELIAKWEKNKYTVTFISEEKVVGEKTVEYKDKVEEIENPIKEGHKFIGWYLEDKKYTFTGEVTKNIELTAKWEKEKYEITFKDYDDSVIEVVIVEYGDTPKINVTPTRQSDAQYSYEFVGWSPNIVTVTENTTYKAVYNSVINKYEVTFVDGDETLNKETVEYGKIISKPNDLTKEGHKFIGWYLGDEKYTFTEEVTKNIELTAKWEKEKYEITFKNYDDSIIKVIKVEYDDIPQIDIIPTRQEDEKYSYVFNGWSPSIEKATKDISYIATYTNYIKYYTVEFIDGDKVINGLSLEYGKKVPKIEDPTKEGYKFIGWYLDGVEYDFETPITKDIKLDAKWEKNKYTVTFTNDEKVVETITVEHGELIDELTVLEKEGYKFLGWYVGDNKYNFETPVTSNLELIAKWEKNKYTITFKNYDGNTLENVTVEHGNMPKYNGTPTRKSDAQYSYEFAGWNPDIVEATKNTSYTATYKSILNKYKVTFADGEDILNEEIVEYGKTVSKPSDLTKEGHKFLGWYVNDTEYNFSEQITGDLKLVAKWEKEKYTVTFTSDEKVIKTLTVEYEETVKEIETPTKDFHKFLGWYVGDTKYNFDTPVKDNLELVAKWEKEKYEITFKNYDGSVIDTVTVEHGNMPNYNGIPTRQSNAQYSYEFAGWNPDIVEATKNTSYTATYKSILNKYTVTFADGEDILNEETVEYGKTVTKPSDLTKEGHIFLGWYVNDKEYNFSEPITGDLKLVAKWEKEKYEITFKNDDGTVLDVITFEYGDMPKYDGTPEKKPVSIYKFMGWSPSLEKVTEDKTYTATYKYLADVDTRIKRRLESFSSSKFHVDKIDNNLHVTFTSYKTENIYGDTVVKEPPFKLIDLFFEVVDFFHIISNEGYYESFEMYYKHEGHATGKTIDLRDYDLTDKSFGSWYGDGANDYVGDWIGYLATGTASTMAAYEATTADLENKVITVTIKLKDGYVLDNGKDVATYYLSF